MQSSEIMSAQNSRMFREVDFSIWEELWNIKTLTLHLDLVTLTQSVARSRYTGFKEGWTVSACGQCICIIKIKKEEVSLQKREDIQIEMTWMLALDLSPGWLCCSSLKKERISCVFLFNNRDTSHKVKLHPNEVICLNWLEVTLLTDQFWVWII